MNNSEIKQNEPIEKEEKKQQEWKSSIYLFKISF